MRDRSLFPSCFVGLVFVGIATLLSPSCKQRSKSAAAKTFENSTKICADISAYAEAEFKKIPDEQEGIKPSFETFYKAIWESERSTVELLVSKYQLKIEEIRSQSAIKSKASELDQVDCDEFAAALRKSESTSTASTSVCSGCDLKTAQKELEFYSGQLKSLGNCATSVAGSGPSKEKTEPEALSAEAKTTAQSLRKALADAVLQYSDIAAVCSLSQQFINTTVSKTCDGDAVEEACRRLALNSESIDAAVSKTVTPQVRQELATVRSKVSQCILGTEDLSQFANLTKFQYDTLFAVESCKAASKLLAKSLDSAPASQFIQQCGTNIKKDLAASCLHNIGSVCENFSATKELDLKEINATTEGLHKMVGSDWAQSILTTAGLQGQIETCVKTKEQLENECKQANATADCADRLYRTRLACESVNAAMAQLKEIYSKGWKSTAAVCAGQLGELFRAKASCVADVVSTYGKRVAENYYAKGRVYTNGVTAEQTCGGFTYRSCCLCDRTPFGQGAIFSSGSQLGAPEKWMGVIEQGEFKSGNCSFMEKSRRKDEFTKIEYQYSDCQKVFVVGGQCSPTPSSKVSIYNPASKSIDQVNIP